MRQKITIAKDGFEEWLKKNNLKNDEPYLVLLGVNPTHYLSLSEEEKNGLNRCVNSRGIISSEPIIIPVFTDRAHQTYEVDSFVGKLKEKIEWEKNWKKFIKKLCSTGLIATQYFVENCSEFISYCKAQNLLTGEVLENLDKKRFEANFDEWLSAQRVKKITKRQAISLMIGLEPKFLERFLSINSEAEVELDKLFHNSYSDFLRYSSNGLFQLHQNPHLIMDELESKFSCFDEVFSFFNQAYQEGYVPCYKLMNHLGKGNNKLEYQKDNWIYRLFLRYSKMDYWSLKDFECLMVGKNPDDESQKMTFYNESSLNCYRISSNTPTGYSIIVKDGGNSPLKNFEERLRKYSDVEKDGNYRPKKLLEIVLEETEIVPHPLLVEMIFGDGLMQQETKPKSSRVSEANFIAYLKKEISDNPNNKPFPKSSDKGNSYELLAKEKYQISLKRFRHCWSEATKNLTKNSSWIKAGAPKKHIKKS
jgi:hypothetical protein